MSSNRWSVQGWWVWAVLAAVGVAAVGVGALGPAMCRPKECEPVCVPPNTFPGELKHVTNGTGTGCLCSCGVPNGAQCQNTEGCALGTECLAPPDLSAVVNKKLGVCTNKCVRQKCPQYYMCRVDDKGDAQCYCNEFSCSTELVSGIKAARDGVIEVFGNPCEVHNANCKIWSLNQNSTLWVRITA